MTSPGGMTTTPAGRSGDLVLGVKLALFPDNSVLINADVDGPYTGRYWSVFVNGILQATTYCPPGGNIEACFPLTQGTEVGSVWLECVGDWAAFDTYVPVGQNEVFEATDAKRIRYSWDNDYTLTDIVGDTQLSALTITGALRGANCQYTDKPTRGRLGITIDTIGTTHYVRYWNNQTIVAEGSRIGNGAVSCAAQNGSGLTVACTLTYTADIRLGTAYIDCRWPSGYQIHYSTSPLSFPRTPQSTVSDMGNDSFLYLSPLLSGGTYYCSVLTIDDDGVVQTAAIPAPAPLVVNVAPNPPTALYATGTAAACVVHWTLSTTPDCEYTVFSSLINEPVNLSNQWKLPAPQSILTAFNANNQQLAPIVNYAPVDRTAYITALKAAFDAAVALATVAYSAGETGYSTALATLSASLTTACNAYRGQINVNIAPLRDACTQAVSRTSDIAYSVAGLYSAGDWLDYMLTPHANMLAQLGELLCNDGGRWQMPDGSVGYGAEIGQSLEDVCDPVVKPGICRVIVQARDNDGNEEHNYDVLEIEFDAAGDVVGSRPNSAYIESWTVTAGRTITAQCAVFDEGAAVDADHLDFYCVPAASAIDYTVPQASSGVLAASVMNLQRAALSYTAGSNGWWRIACAARASGVRSLTSLEQLVWLSDAAPNAVQNLVVKVIRGKGTI